MIRSNIHRMLLGACVAASSALACSALAQDRDDTKKTQSAYSAGQTRAADHDADDQNRMQGRNDADDRGRALGRNARNDHDADDHARALGRKAGNNRDTDDRMQARNSDHDADDRGAAANRDKDDRSGRTDRH
jgi:hypothetical protein